MYDRTIKKGQKNMRKLTADEIQFIFSYINLSGGPGFYELADKVRQILIEHLCDIETEKIKAPVAPPTKMLLQRPTNKKDKT